MRYDDLKRIKTLIIVATLVMTAVILAACGRSSSEQATGSSSSASWAVPLYSDVAALGEGSDLIVIAKESDHSIEYRHELAFTHSYMKISKVYKGDAECGDVVDVLLTGDTHEEGYASRAGELPYILEGKEYILFLQLTSDETYGVYYNISGGYRGIAVVRNNEYIPLIKINSAFVDGFKDYLDGLLYDQSSLIQNYISYLGGDYEKGEAKYYCMQAGMLTRSDLLPQMDLIEAENQGLLGEVPSMAETVRVQKIYAQDQHELVIQQFGEDAWDNVSYTIEELDPIDGKGGYRIKATGEQIDRARYDGIINLFWLKVAQEEGVELSDILLTEDEGSEALANKRVDIISKYIDEIPVELVSVSEEKTFDVKLAFNGRTSSEDGYEGFHFVIVGSDEKGWVIFQGLSWDVPVPEYPVNEI